MRKQVRRHGKLLQGARKRIPEIQQAEVTVFRVTATSSDLQNAWVEAEYPTFEEAQSFVDELPKSEVNYYIHSDSNRVLYFRKGIVNA
jgi:hypothetical protein